MAINKAGIKVTFNGPYLISGNVPLIVQTIVLDQNGDPLEWKETRRYQLRQSYSLCRCGKSKTRPFCDGTHQDINFDGTETADMRPHLDQSEKFIGPELDLTDAKPLCANAGFCDRAGGTWNLISKSNDPAAKKIAVEETFNCPSGRLVVWDKQGNTIEPKFEPSISLMAEDNRTLSGPIWVRGGIPIESSDGKIYEIRNRVTLCGCGQSSNKPFCDGSHRRNKT